MVREYLNLLRHVLCPNMWSILENIPCALEKYVYSGALGGNALTISIKSICSKAAVSLLIFYLENLSIEAKGVLKSLIMTVFLSIVPL